jgi:hypothetical protein
MDRTKTIAELNDQLRKDPHWKITLQTFASFIYENHHKWMITPEVSYLPQDQLEELITKVRELDDFTPENDPYSEHNFGKVAQDDVNYFWKINYYDLDFESRTVDPADPVKTRRVLILMKATNIRIPFIPCSHG